MQNNLFLTLAKELCVFSQKKTCSFNSLKCFLSVIFNNPTIFISDYFISKNISQSDILKHIEQLSFSILLKIEDSRDFKDDTDCLAFIFAKCRKFDLRNDIRKETLLNCLLKNFEVCRSFFSSFINTDDLMNYLDEVENSFLGDKASISSLSCRENSGIFNDSPIEEGVIFDEKKFIEDNDDVLSYFSSITDEVRDSIHHPAIGRDNEILKVIHVLNKKNKPNCILIGKAGVGKTAIVEGLAYNFANNIGDNGNLSNSKVYSLNICQLIAGTSYRGQAEERISKILDYFESKKNIILFIDEIHMIVGAAGKSTNDSCDLSNILKPYLSRGKIICIGATTLDEYSQYIAPDSALERRFSIIEVKEPLVNDVKTILLNIKNKFELYHGIKYGKNTIKNIINICDEFIKDKNYPDKAIDILDSYGAYLKLHSLPANKKTFISFCSFYLNFNEDITTSSIGFISNNEYEKPKISNLVS